MNTTDDLINQHELESILERERQERERQIQIDQELRQIAINENDDVVSKGWPTGDRPGEDD